MQTASDYVAGCQQWLRDTDQDLNDPDVGPVDRCHHPVPRHAGGRTTVDLPRYMHAVQGILQSNEVGSSCVFGSWEKEAILNGPFVEGWFQLLDDLDHWRSAHAREAARALHRSKMRDGRSRAAVRAAHARWAA